MIQDSCYAKSHLGFSQALSMEIFGGDLNAHELYRKKVPGDNK